MSSSSFLLKVWLANKLTLELNRNTESQSPTQIYFTKIPGNFIAILKLVKHCSSLVCKLICVLELPVEL